MTELEQRIKEQIDYCLEYEYFRSVIWISPVGKMEKVKNILVKYVNELPDDIMRRCFQSNESEFQIDFVLKHSNLKVLKCSDKHRGIKCGGCLIDKDISDYDKGNLIYTKLIPRIIDIQNGIWEPSEKLQERVHEVEI